MTSHPPQLMWVWGSWDILKLNTTGRDFYHLASNRIHQLCKKGMIFDMMTSLYVYFYINTNFRAQLEETIWCLFSQGLHLVSHSFSSPTPLLAPIISYLRKLPGHISPFGTTGVDKFCFESTRTYSNENGHVQGTVRENQSANFFVFYREKQRGSTQYDVVVCLKLLLLK